VFKSRYGPGNGGRDDLQPVVVLCAKSVWNSANRMQAMVSTLAAVAALSLAAENRTHIVRLRTLLHLVASVFRITKVENPRIIPLLLTSKIVPMQYVQGLTTEVVSADQLTPTYLGNLVR
jgi:hypothetical protein